MTHTQGCNCASDASLPALLALPILRIHLFVSDPRLMLSALPSPSTAEQASSIVVVIVCFRHEVPLVEIRDVFAFSAPPLSLNTRKKKGSGASKKIRVLFSQGFFAI